MDRGKTALYRFFVVLCALSVALGIGAVLFLLAGANPLKAYEVMLLGPLKDSFGLSEILVRAAPLTMVALGITIAFRSGILNIGGEGQIQIGAICGAAVALLYPEAPWYIVVPLSFCAAFAGGALWGGIAGWMRAYLSVNEILSTVMLNYVAFQLYMFLIRGPMIDPKEVAYGTGVPQTALVDRALWLWRMWRPTRLHSGILLAIVLALSVYLFLWKTPVGYRLRATGAGKRAARYGGIRVNLYLVLAMMLSGGFAGLAGANEVLGIHHRALESLSAGYGFSGIVVALFGGLHPLGTIPAAFFFGVLIVGADMMQRAVSVPAAIVLAIQGLVIMSIVSSQVFIADPRMRNRLKRLVSRPDRSERKCGDYGD
ncbi:MULTISPECIES: ABC transporter permease [Dethiosulfovibrio]|uniref:ABC transporter permease n=2 Tax=Dethiosulfovibrio TaxID=47054 RepID=A0ABS9ENW7_9BACT|nr:MULTISPECIES: ABC transporter permease [Dethiosulfovibrio]MCF4114664.1 ABC transporter permease [Dethiosulfovibrio russensis]MCF4142887.1 ABC transporter permease [Dethiosulfovibrio marinus]MCF4144784.1 ABC transporter permease [Dethiosulfovibrio acidaminovorans]